MDGTKIGILKERNEVSFNGFLEGTDGRRLEAKVGLEVLSDFTNETLEGELSDQKLGRLLITTDLTESDGTRLISVRLLDTTMAWGTLTSSLMSKLLTRSLSSSRFTGGLLGTSHRN
jgi:histone H3